MKMVYTSIEVSQMLGLTRTSIYTMARKGQLPSIKIGGAVLFPKKEIDSLLQSSHKGENDKWIRTTSVNK